MHLEKGYSRSRPNSSVQAGKISSVMSFFEQTWILAPHSLALVGLLIWRPKWGDQEHS